MHQIREKVNPITLRSKRLIVKSLIELMDKKRFSEISLKEISENAGLTRQTIYRNFDTKEEILEYYVDELYEDFLAIISAKEDITLYDLLITYFEYWYENREFIKKLIDNNVYQLLLCLHLKYLNSMALDEKFINLIFTPDKENNNYFNHFSAGGLWFALKNWVEDGTKKTPAEMTNIILHFYHMKGLSTENIVEEK